MRSISKLCASAFLCASSLACSVKETRTDCPCLLSVNVEDCFRYAGEAYLSVWMQSGSVAEEHLGVAPGGGAVELDVPRGIVEYSACVGLDGDAVGNRELRMALDERCEGVFAYAATLSTDCESIADTVVLHKQFARVTVRIDSMSFADEDVSVVVSSSWNGLSLGTLSPIAGNWQFRPEREPDGSWRFNMLRQGDNSIRMDIYAGGKLKRCIELGKYLEDLGFDWAAEDLDDISVCMGSAESAIVVEIEDWSPGDIYDM